MAYLDITTLEEAKNTLRVDDTLTEDDSKIANIIGAAWQFIERWTNVIVSQQAAKEYVITDRCVRVYDYPINSVVKGIDKNGDDISLIFETNYDKELKSLYTNFYNIDGDAVKLVLDVGHILPTSVKQDLKEVADEIIDILYFQHRTGKTLNDLSELSKITLNNYKRFLI